MRLAVRPVGVLLLKGGSSPGRRLAPYLRQVAKVVVVIADLRTLLEVPRLQPVERVLRERLVTARQVILAQSEAAVGIIPIAERESLTFADAREEPGLGLIGPESDRAVAERRLRELALGVAAVHAPVKNVNARCGIMGRAAVAPSRVRLLSFTTKTRRKRFLPRLLPALETLPLSAAGHHQRRQEAHPHLDVDVQARPE